MVIILVIFLEETAENRHEKAAKALKQEKEENFKYFLENMSPTTTSQLFSLESCEKVSQNSASEYRIVFGIPVILKIDLFTPQHSVHRLRTTTYCT